MKIFLILACSIIPLYGSECETKSIAAAQSPKITFPATPRLTQIWAKLLRDHSLEQEFNYLTPLIAIMANKTLSLEETQTKVLCAFAFTNTPKLSPRIPAACHRLAENNTECVNLEYIIRNKIDYCVAFGIWNAVDEWQKYSIDALD